MRDAVSGRESLLGGWARWRPALLCISRAAIEGLPFPARGVLRPGYGGWRGYRRVAGQRRGAWFVALRAGEVLPEGDGDPAAPNACGAVMPGAELGVVELG